MTKKQIRQVFRNLIDTLTNDDERALLKMAQLVQRRDKAAKQRGHTLRLVCRYEKTATMEELDRNKKVVKTYGVSVYR